MSYRMQSLLLGLAMIFFAPFIFLYLLAYHHFEDKQHPFATCIEYINGLLTNLHYGFTGNNRSISIYNENELDWWLRKGRIIKRYTGLSKKEVMRLNDLLRFRIMYFRKYDESLPPKEMYKSKNKAISFVHSGYEDYNNYIIFRKDGSFSLINEYRDDEVHGQVDDNFFETVKAWNERKYETKDKNI